MAEAVASAEMIHLKDFKAYIGDILSREATEYIRINGQEYKGLIWCIAKELEGADFPELKDIRGLINFICDA